MHLEETKVDVVAEAGKAGKAPRGEPLAKRGGTAKRGIASKQEVLLKSLSEFYHEHPEHLALMTRAVRKPKPHVSLRILDWLVTNYAKKHNIVYIVDRPDGPTAFNMHLEYKSQLKAYSKRYFDPFCRRDRIAFGSPAVPTTVGQLNFFRWAILNGVVAFGAQHAKDIEADMMRSKRDRGPGDTKSRRRELSRGPKTCKTPLTFVIRF